MHLKYKAVSLLFVTLLSVLFVNDAFCVSFKQVKGIHFIIEYADGVETKFAKNVLRKAETFYDKIASRLGYSRYDNYWTWDKRAKIILYLNKESFINEADQPEWAVGVSVHDKRLFETRTIISYQRDHGFLKGILPHEIGHLIFHDFVGKDKEIPVWFDEGVAQLCESNKKAEANRIMRFMVGQGLYIPLKDLMNVTLNKNDTKENIAIFYSQSVSLVDFLITKYGNDKFLRLCKELRDGRSFESALERVYSKNFGSLDDFEEEWVNYIKGKK